jgi:hypothetical protein
MQMEHVGGGGVHHQQPQLCIGHQDAIADIGKVTIETENVNFDDDYCTEHKGFSPGA